jgi:MoaA/NifB/PqqE/SkfB family radical SAM enzyme
MMPSYDINQITWFPTRRCNLKCEYCKIRSNNFPEIRGIKQWEKLLINVKKLSPNGFFQILGGEIGVYPEKTIIDLIKILNDLGFIYAMYSNSILLTPKLAEKLMKVGIKNWTVSIDSLEGGLPTEMNKKGVAAMKAVDIFSKLGLKDIHCTITVTRHGVRSGQILEVVDWAESKGAYSEITPLIWAKNKYYDFASPKEEMRKCGGLVLNRFDDFPPLMKLLKEMILRKKAGYKIHNTDYYLATYHHWVWEVNWKCHIPSLVIDSDGTLKPCIHLKGNKTRELNIFKREISKAELFYAFALDHTEQCEGCFWDCLYESEHMLGEGKLDEIKKYYAHEQK